MTVTTNPYLEGNFAPVLEEVTAIRPAGDRPRARGDSTAATCATVPIPSRPPSPRRYHWFTGDGMVHGIRLRDGRAEWYRNRWVRSAAVAHALGEEPHPAAVHAGMDFGPNTNVIGHAGPHVRHRRGGARPYELTNELETIGPCDFGGTLDGGYTAHPSVTR